MALTFTGAPTTPVVGHAYTFTPTLSGGTSPYTVTATPPLPAGYTLDAKTGVITSTGVPEGERFTTVLHAVDSTTEKPLSADLSVTLTPIKPPQIMNPALPEGEVGVALHWVPNTQYGNGSTIKVTVEPKTLPAGLSVSDVGVISGAPTTSGEAQIKVTVSDGTNTASQILTSTVVPAVALAGTAPKGYVVSTYKFSPVASAGKPPYTWTVSALPKGLSFDQSTGVITGTFSTPGKLPVNISVVDSLGGSASLSTTINVEEAIPLLFAIPSLSQNTVTSIVISADDVSESAKYAVSGTLPKGLIYTADTHTISGTPTESGSFPLTVTVTDGDAVTTRLATLAVAGGTIPAGDSVHPLDITFATAVDVLDNYLKADLSTATNQAIASAQLLKVTRLLLRAPTQLALTLMWAKHVQYSDSVFGKDVFTNLLNAAPDKRTAALMSTVHTAFHQALTQPATVTNLDSVIRLARQPHLVSFLETKIGHSVG